MTETENLPQSEPSLPDDQKTSRASSRQEPAPFPWVTLPSGTVTFLFTDIEGSTPLWERDPRAMEVALQVHHTTLTQAIANHQGVAFKCTGDGFVAAFSTASQALLSALDAQRALAAAKWNELGPLKVRMGLHTGEAQPDPGLNDYFSPAAPRAQRVMSAGHGGQVLLSQETADLCRRSLPEGVFLKDLGSHRLKGLPEPERLFQVVAPGLESEFPLLQTLDRFPNNLPVQLTSFIGREKESAEVMRLLGQTRLLTLSGVGGTGKTRLALHVASEALEQFPDGAWLVELAPLSDPVMILPTVAAVFGFFTDTPEMPLETRLHYHLHNKQALLVLDNCEHLIQEAARFTNYLLQAAPQVKVLTTSREALGLAGETIYLVPSLALPDATQSSSLETLAQVDAIRLFLERARAVRPDFGLSKTNAAEIAQVCARLDGIPLALELAAARVKIFSTGQILERLDQRFRLLTGGSRASLPRQQTLQAAIDWSYNLLPESEKALLRMLAVFKGGWSLDAAEGVCACPGQPEDVADLLGQLVNKSLVEVEVQENQPNRYRMLETVRQYAQEKLDQAGESSQMRDRHLAYFRQYSDDFEEQYHTSTGDIVFEILSHDLDNIRVALEWAFDGPNQNNVIEGIRLVNNLLWPWVFSDLNDEALSWTKKGLALLDDQNPITRSVRAKALYCASRHCSIVDFFRDCAIYARESVNLYRQFDDDYGTGVALVWLASCANYLEPNHPYAIKEEESALLANEGKLLLRRSGIKIGLIQAFETELVEAIERGEYDTARNLVYERASLIQEGDLSEMTKYWYLGSISDAKHDFPLAIEQYKKTIEYMQKYNMRAGIAMIANALAYIHFKQGEYDQAEEYFHLQKVTAQETASRWEYTDALRKLAEISLMRKDYRQAGSYLEEGMTLAPDVDPEILVGNCLAPLLEATEGIAQPRQVARLLGFIECQVDILARSERVRKLHERIKNGVLARLDEPAFQAEYETGKEMTRQQLISQARVMAQELKEYHPSG